MPGRPTLSDAGDAPIYRPVAVRSAIAAGAVVALLYCFRFARILPVAAAEAASLSGFLVLVGLGWAAINGLPGFSIRRGKRSLGELLRLVLYVAAIWFYLYVMMPQSSHGAASDYLFGCLVLFGLWWAGMIGSVGSLLSRESHPLYAVLLLAFYVTAALLVLFWFAWHVTPQTPLVKVAGLADGCYPAEAARLSTGLYGRLICPS